MASVMLIDGNSLTYRAFFALPTDLATAGGQVTNAVYGFTAMLINLVRDHKPDQIVVTFDRPEPTFRHERLDTYKANRDAAPDILREQMGLVRKVVEVLGLPIVEIVGFEADDVIATLTSEAVADGLDVLIVTGDRDSYQLVSDPQVKVLYNKRGVSDYALYDEAGIRDRTGVSPADYVTYAALRGDPSDNLPGVPGVGEKTAAKLVNAYGDLDGIFAHVDEQTPKLRSNLSENEAQARVNAELMVLRTDAPIGRTLAELVSEPQDPAEIKQLFEFLEFNTLLARLPDAFDVGPIDVGAESDAVLDPTIEIVGRSDAVEALAALGRATTILAVGVAWSGQEGRSALEAVALCSADEPGPASRVLAFGADVLADPAFAAELDGLLSSDRHRVHGHDVKASMRALLPMGVDVRSLALDTAVAGYLLEPADTNYPVADLVRRYAGFDVPALDAAAEGQLDFGAGTAPAAERAGMQSASVAAVSHKLAEAMVARGLDRLNDEIEVPLVRVLARMEVVGIGVDTDELKGLNTALIEECNSLTKEIWADAGHEFNVNSTPQLREVLFTELGLTPQKKTKTGFSTDATSLEKLVGAHPIIDHLLRYREVEKLRSTYGEGLLSEIAADGRIHATFNQTVARTGRLSSDAPNLHNIPVRSEAGRLFRKAFVPAPGHELLVADYNQIELRCIAHLSNDPGLVAAFEAGDDIHRSVASQVFGVAPEDVTFEQRSKAKMVSYGLAYGMEAYGLAQRLSIEPKDAQVILEAYFAAFPSVRAYMDRTVEEARDRGYTETLFGRRRQIPELSSSNFRIRQAGERQAKNAGIQGLAADIFKVALVRLDRNLDENGLAARIVLQVHDEVLVEASQAERAEVERRTLDAMHHAFDLRVPLEVNLAWGPSWADAKG